MSTDPDRAARAYASHLGVAFADLERHEVPRDLLDQVPSDCAHRWQVIPVATKDGRLILATPGTPDANERVLDASIDLRRPCDPAIADPRAFRARLLEYYPGGGAPRDGEPGR